MSTGLKANSDGSAAIQVGGTDVITLTSGGAATFVTSPTTVQAGTAAAPSITFSGDTNTGIYSPGADQVAIATGGTAAVTVSSSQNVGIGTTSPNRSLTIVGSLPNVLFSNNATNNNSKYASIATAHYNSVTYPNGCTLIGGEMQASANIVHIGGFFGESKAATTIAFYTAANNTTDSGTERARIDSAGNFGLGATPSAWGSNYKAIESTGASGVYFVCNNVNECGIGSNIYATNSAFVRTSTGAASVIRANNGQIQTYTAASGNAGTNITFTSGPFVANLGTSWTNSSDERLKNITGEIQNGVQKVMSLRAAEFTWKDGENTKPQVGLIAQDLLTVLPEVVVVPETETDSQGNPTFLGVNYDQVIPLLVAAIKEQQAMIDELKAKVAALEGA